MIKEWKIRKESEKKLVFEEIPREFNDSYNEVHVRQYYLDKMGITPPCTITQTSNPNAFNYFYRYFNRVNKYIKRTPIPNKRVTQEVYGASLLRRTKDGREITLQYRKGGQKTPSYTFISRNAMPLNEIEGDTYSCWNCYNSFYIREGFNGGRVYYINSTHPDWNFWNKTMDENYASLVGVDFSYKPRVRPGDTKEVRETLDAALMWIGLTPFRDIINQMAEEHLCTIDQDSQAVYDKEGYWMYDLEEFEDSENEYQFFCLLEYLNSGDLRRVIKILDSFIKYDE